MAFDYNSRRKYEKAAAERWDKKHALGLAGLVLSSYGLLSLKDREDTLHRYAFLQNFLRESRQFGAQRRQSEALAVQTALRNMATTAGYADATRLTLAMETGMKQPFRQVFREFYLKLEEEMDASASRMFAGYQIQPKKTVAALKGRRWVADYENGLQKIWFGAGIVTELYALADWFSPADTECPTLEYVAFSDRRTYKPVRIADVPDVLYSETSHSTIEMRKVILAFNMELFSLKNVTFEGTHAFIEGTMGRYTVHLGSGVIHRADGGMVNILPVHSQQRGKIFLPFIDEDPKTAEILSKILLLAEDGKIKDPYILRQIR